MIKLTFVSIRRLSVDNGSWLKWNNGSFSRRNFSIFFLLSVQNALTHHEFLHQGTEIFEFFFIDLLCSSVNIFSLNLIKLKMSLVPIDNRSIDDTLDMNDFSKTKLPNSFREIRANITKRWAFHHREIRPNKSNIQVNSIRWSLTTNIESQTNFARNFDKISLRSVHFHSFLTRDIVSSDSKIVESSFSSRRKSEFFFQRSSLFCRTFGTVLDEQNPFSIKFRWISHANKVGFLDVNSKISRPTKSAMIRRGFSEPLHVPPLLIVWEPVQVKWKYEIFFSFQIYLELKKNWKQPNSNNKVQTMEFLVQIRY